MWQTILQAPLLVKICLVMVLFIIVGAIFADILIPYDPNDTILTNRNLPPVFAGGTFEHILGTDELGRDILSRILYGTRISLGMALLGLVFGSLIGVTLGLTAGYFGGRWDQFVMMLINFQQSIPFTLVILLGVVVFGRSILVLMLFIGFAMWETYARFVRSLVLSIKENQYIEAAKSYNASSRRIIFRHILPGVISTIIVLITLNFPSVLMLESSLSFIGIGVQPPTATLGQMVGTGRNYLATNFWISVLPAIVIVLLSFSVQHIGTWLRDKLDVKMADH